MVIKQKFVSSLTEKKSHTNRMSIKEFDGDSDDCLEHVVVQRLGGFHANHEKQYCSAQGQQKQTYCHACTERGNQLMVYLLITFTEFAR